MTAIKGFEAAAILAISTDGNLDRMKLAIPPGWPENRKATARAEFDKAKTAFLVNKER